MRPAFAVLLTLLMVSPSPALSRDEQTAVLALTVNEVRKGDIIVILRRDDVLARVEDLEQSGLRGFTGQREPVQGVMYVSVASLAPGITFVLDEHTLALRLTAQPAFLGATVVDLQGGRPADLVYREDTSAFVNYAVQALDFESFTLFGEAGLRLGKALLFSGASRNGEGDVVRGLSNITIDDREDLVRWTGGDFVARPDALSNALFMGGVSVSREFTIDPYFTSFPTVSLSGTAATPATADVYVNGLLLRRTELPPGSFELRNLQVPSGAGTARVVVRDVFGREQVIPSAFYFTPRLLTEGLHEYSYGLGFRRNNVGTESWDYDRLGFRGQHRIGFTRALTVGARLEGAADLVSGGPMLTAALPFGEIELAAAGSRETAASGAAASIGYRYASRAASFGAAARVFSDRYATLQLAPHDDRARSELSAFAGNPAGDPDQRDGSVHAHGVPRS